MAKKSTGRPVGRPKGTRTAVVELETVSFKAPKEFVEQVKRYAKQRSRPVSELVRDGLEWRIGEGDPLNMRRGTVTSGESGYEGNTGNTDMPGGSVEALHGMLVVLVEEVRQLHTSVQTIEQRLGEPGSMQAPSITSNIDVTSADGDMPVASMKAQMRGAGSVYTSSVTGNTDVSSVAGDTPRVMVEVPSASEQPSAGIVPEFDPAKYAWGPLCEHGHDADGQGHSLRQRGGKHECRECKNTRSRAYKERRRQAQPVAG